MVKSNEKRRLGIRLCTGHSYHGIQLAKNHKKYLFRYSNMFATRAMGKAYFQLDWIQRLVYLTFSRFQTSHQNWPWSLCQASWLHARDYSAQCTYIEISTDCRMSGVCRFLILWLEIITAIRVDGTGFLRNIACSFALSERSFKLGQYSYNPPMGNYRYCCPLNAFFLPLVGSWCWKVGSIAWGMVDQHHTNR